MNTKYVNPRRRLCKISSGLRKPSQHEISPPRHRGNLPESIIVEFRNNRSYPNAFGHHFLARNQGARESRKEINANFSKVAFAKFLKLKLFAKNIIKTGVLEAF